MNRNEKLKKLVTHMNGLNQEPTEKDMEYIYLDTILTDDQMIDAALALELRVPTYIDELASRIGKSIEETAQLCFEMAKAGVIYYDADAAGVDRVNLPIFVPGSMECGCMRPSDTDKHPQLAYTFDKYIDNACDGITRFIRMGEGLVRALPVESAIQNEPRRAAVEEVNYWVEKYAPSLGIAPCECRHTRVQNGEGAHDLEGEWCMMLGAFAESCIRTGKARRISKQEAYDILREAEKRGYAHEILNIDGNDESLFICNCEWATCGAYRTAWYCNTPNACSSNYRATVNEKTCVACGKCVDVCMINAVRLTKRGCDKSMIKPALIPGVPGYNENPTNHELLTEWKHVVPETGTVACVSDCPAHISMEGYIKLIREGSYEKALELMKKDNPFPSICGTICSRPCEANCARAEKDEALQIDIINQVMLEEEANGLTWVPEKEFNEGKKVAVIGSGPAGLSCAYYLAKMGHQVTVFEKETWLGGMLALTPEYRFRRDILEKEIDVLRKLGVRFETGAEIGKFLTIPEMRDMGFKAFYLAIGAQGIKKPGIPGEDAEGVISGIDFLKKMGQTGHAHLGKKTIVLGSGNIALDVARSAFRTKETQVFWFSELPEEKMYVNPEELKEARYEGVNFTGGMKPVRIMTKGSKVCGVEFANGRERTEVPCSTVLLAGEQAIEWGTVLDESKVGLNADNTAVTVPVTDVTTYLTAPSAGDPTGNYHVPTPFEVYQTAEPDIFVGGDVYYGSGSAIDAVAAGKEAAESIHRFVWPGHNLVFGRDRNLYHADGSKPPVQDYNKTPRRKAKREEGNSMRLASYSLAQALRETRKCLRCGAAYVDETLCIGCGLCVEQCKFDAITLYKKYDVWGVTYEELGGHLMEDIGAFMAEMEAQAAGQPAAAADPADMASIVDRIVGEMTGSDGTVQTHAGYDEIMKQVIEEVSGAPTDPGTDDLISSIISDKRSARM